MRCRDLDAQSIFLFIQRGAFEKGLRSPPSSILHLKGLFKWPRAAIDFSTLISRLHYEEFCYLHLRPVFLPPQVRQPHPVGCALIHRRTDDAPNPQRAHMHVHLLSHGREPRLTEDQTAPWAARWRRRQMEEQMLDSGHKIKSRQDFKEKRKKNRDGETISNLNMCVCEDATNSRDAEKFSTSWLSFPVSRPGNCSRLRHKADVNSVVSRKAAWKQHARTWRRCLLVKEERGGGQWSIRSGKIENHSFLNIYKLQLHHFVKNNHSTVWTHAVWI